MTLAKGDLDKIDNKLDIKLDRQKEDILNAVDDKLQQLKSDFFEKIDPILKEVVASREDRTIGAEQHRRNQDRIEKLEEIHPQGKHLAAV